MSTSSTGLANVGSSILGATGVSSPGIGSGLDVNGIVSKLMNVEAQPIVLLQNQQSSYQTQLSSIGSVSSALSQLQGAMGGLTNLSSLQSMSATPSNSSVVTATAGSLATAGSYNIGVTTLAQAQTLVAAGQANTTSAIGSGSSTTLTFSFGTTTGTVTTGVYQAGTTFSQDPTQPTKKVTIDSTNNSLTGIMNAINAANIGVTATIVNDGTGTPYRLALTSSSGAAHSMEIAVSGDTTLQSLLNFNPTQTAGSGQNMTESVSPKNAALTVNGLSITSASNSVTGAISGVTLNLTGTGSSSLNVAYNSSTVQSAIQNFVNAYNTVNSTINTLTAYDPSTKTAGPLLGDFATLSVQTGLRGVLSQPLTGLGNKNITTLAQLGITFQKDGSLAFDTTAFASAAASNPSEIAAMFAPIGQPTDSLISYATSTSKTQAGSYAVTVSQLATQANETGTGTVGASTVISTGSNVVTNASMAAAGAVTDLGANSISFGVSVGGGAVNTVTVNGLSTGSSFNAKLNAADIANAVNTNASVAAAGLVASVDSNGNLNFATSNGQSVAFSAFTGGTFTGMSGLGTGLSNSFSAAGAMTNAAETDTITVAGVPLTVTATGTATTDASALQTAINGNATLQSMGITAALSSTNNSVVITASDARAVSLAITPGTNGTNTLASWGFSSGTASEAALSKYNNTLSLSVDGYSTTVTLAPGTYSQANLASLVQSAINGDSTLSAANSSASVAINGSNNAIITSNRYGASSSVSVTAGGGAYALIGTSGSSTAGLDVAGTINGTAATGSGQFMTGAAGTPTEGLELQVKGGSTGSRGTVNFSLGYADQLNNTITDYLSSTGVVTTATNSINTNIQSINSQISTMSQHLVDVQNQYLAQFQALDTIIAQMTTTGNYLTQQFTSMSYTQKNYG